MDRTNRSYPGFAVAAVAIALLAGCGGSGKSTASSSTGSGVSTVASGPSGSAGASGGGSGSALGSSTAPGSSTTPGSSTAPGGTSGSSGAVTKPKATPTTTAPAGQEGASAPSVNACSLASGPDVVKAFGGKVSSATTSTTGTGAQLCRFIVANARVAKNLTITLSTHKPVTAADFKAGQASAVKAGATKVSGVGSGAYFTRATGTLQFLTGNIGGFVQVQAPLAPGTTLSTIEPGAVALAKTVVGNS